MSIHSINRICGVTVHITYTTRHSCSATSFTGNKCSTFCCIHIQSTTQTTVYQHGYFPENENGSEFYLESCWPEPCFRMPATSIPICVSKYIFSYNHKGQREVGPAQMTPYQPSQIGLIKNNEIGTIVALSAQRYDFGITAEQENAPACAAGLGQWT